MSLTVQGGGALPKDGNLKKINLASSARNRDNTGTPLESPIAVSNTVIELVASDRDLMITIGTIGGALRIGDNSSIEGVGGAGYFVLPLNKSLDLPIADGGSLFVVRDSVDVTVSISVEIA